MRTETITKDIFTFDELNDGAKEKARDWFRSCIEADELTNDEDWQNVAAILGVSFDERRIRLMNGNTRGEPKIYWSGFSSQGDGASFEGDYCYSKGAPKRIREYAPQDTELHRIADELQAVQRKHFYKLRATMGQGSGSNFYSHSGTMSVDVEHADDSWRDIGDSEDVVRVLMRDFADWIYSQLEAQWDYLNSDEHIDDCMDANGYEFTEEGEPA